MNARISGLIGVMAALAAACKSDPTASEAGTPASILVSFSSLTLAGVGSTGSFTAGIVDSRLTPLGGAITFTTCDPTVASIVIDGTYHPVPNTNLRAVVTGTSLNKTCVVASASGLKPESLSVFVMPVFLPATISNLTPKGGDTVTVTSTNPLLPFDTTALGVTFPGGTAGIVLSKSTTSFRALVPYSIAAAEPLRINGVTVSYAGTNVTLPAPGQFKQTGDLWGGDSSYASAPDIGGYIPAVAGDSTLVTFTTIGANNAAAMCGEGPAGGSSGPCMIFKVTVAAADSVTFSLSWPSGDGGGQNPDVDTYFCTAANPASCFGPGGGAGATVSDPEVISLKLAPGTYYYVAEYFAACDQADPTKCGGNGAVLNYALTIIKH